MFDNSLTFLIHGVLTAAAFVFLLRVLVQLGGVDFYNGVCQFCYRLTNPLLQPLRKLIPRWRKLDIAALLFFVLLVVLREWLLLVVRGIEVDARLLLYIVDALLDFLYWTLVIALIIQMIGVWLVRDWQRNDLIEACVDITAPFLWPIRKLIPAFQTLDLSPMVLLFLLTLFRLLLIDALAVLVA
jgi:YggT family protein